MTLKVRSGGKSTQKKGERTWADRAGTLCRQSRGVAPSCQRVVSGGTAHAPLSASPTCPRSPVAAAAPRTGGAASPLRLSAYPCPAPPPRSERESETGASAVATGGVTTPTTEQTPPSDGNHTATATSDAPEWGLGGGFSV